jgi:prepilin-type N-terminal cleavage/methylation domain-containing protein
MIIADTSGPMMRVSRHRPSRRRRDGFTLMEMMTVVIIIGIAAAIAAPAVHSARIEAKTNRAALELVRLAHNARAESMMYGRAHLVRFTSAARGTFTTYRGSSTNCNTNTWGTMLGTACGAPLSSCIDLPQLAPSGPGDAQWDVGDSTIDATSDRGWGTVDICYEPTGRMQWRVNPAAPFTDLNSDGVTSLNGGFRFVFQRRDSGAAEGVPRVVVVPLGGEARLMQ